MIGGARSESPAIIASVLAIGLLAASCGPSLVWYGRTPDRRHLVQVLEHRGCQYVSLDGVEGPRFDGVAPETVKLSDDAARLAYAVKTGEQWRVISDGRAGPPWDGIGAVVLGPGGGRLAYAAQRGDRWHVVVDGGAGPGFDELEAGSLRFSPDGLRVAYIGQRGGSVHAVIDGEQGPAFEGIAALTFGEGGRRVGYLGRGEGFEQLVLDGLPRERFDEISELALGRGDRVALLARDFGGWFAVVDGRRGPVHDAVLGLAFAPDGEAAAYVARDRGRERLIVGDREQPAFDLILPATLIFDPRDGEPVYAAAVGERVFMVQGKVPGPPFDRIGVPRFSPDGRLLYTAERGGRGVLVIGDQVIDEYVWAGSPASSRDGRRTAYVARKGERMLVITEATVSVFDVVVAGSLVFTDDGRHWACLAGSFEERELRLVIDGRETDRVFDWDELIAGVSVDPFAFSDDADAMAMFRDWVAAETALELEGRAATE